MSYLLDTDTVSAHLRTNRTVAPLIMQYLGQVHVSTITVGELTAWVLRMRVSRRRAVDLEIFLREVNILPVAEPVARKFGKLRAELLDRGRPTPTMDLWNAATAIVHDLTLVTHNVKDFEHMPDLAITDWTIE